MISNHLPLQELLRNPEVRARLHREARIELLKVEGEPDLVVQDAARYEAEREELDRLRLAESIRTADRELQEGGGADWNDVRAELRARHDL